MRPRYEVVGTPSCGTPGSSLAVDSEIYINPTFGRELDTIGFQGSPLVLLHYTTPELRLPYAGDIHLGGRPEPSREKLRRKRAFYVKSGEPTLSPLFYAPPDPQALFNTRLWEERPGERVRMNKERLKKWPDTFNALGLRLVARPGSDYDVTLWDILNEIQLHLLLEPDNGVTWDMWTADEVWNFLNDRLQTFLNDTELLVEDTWTTSLDDYYPNVSVPQLQLTLPSNVGKLITILSEGVSILYPIDPASADLLIPNSETPQNNSEVRNYIYYPGKTNTIRFVPPFAIGQQVDLHYWYIPVLPTYGPADAPLPFPDWFAPSVKYGVMADMLSKQGRANDPQRASYCEQRYQEGVQLAKVLMGNAKEEEKA